MKDLLSRIKIQRLQTRLTLLILAITAPLLIIVGVLVTARAGDQINQDASEQLRLTNSGLAANTTTWLDYNIRALKELVSLPGMASMDAATQRPILQAMQKNYPEMYLISTTDLAGMNIARNDETKLTDYSDRQWFKGAKSGAPITFQSLIGRTTNQPALVASIPIKDSGDQIVGVGMFAIELTQIADKTKASTVGNTGFAYVIDESNRVIAHPNTKFTGELRDFSAEPPVVALRGGTKGTITFVDADGVRWQAYVTELGNKWGVVVQQREDEVLSAEYEFQHIAFLFLGIGTLLLLALSWLIIHQAVRPIRALTETAVAISGGDLNRVAPVESADEVGTLARTFNTMTSQLRELIGNLEHRVAARTRDLQIAADVSRQITTVLDINVLLNQVASLTAKNFSFYAVVVFLMDEKRQKLIRTASSNSAGQPVEMGSANSIPLQAEPSIVAQAARTCESVTINDVTKSAIYLPVAALPNTRSELAIPMIVAEQVIGVFDLQADTTSRFADEDQRVLTALAEQIGIAVRNAQLFAEAQTARKAAEDANKVKSQFLANMSHELRTPLNAILNFTGFVLDEVFGEINEEQKDALRKTIDSGQHLLSLINDILDLTKIEVGMMDLFIQDVDLNAALQGVLSTAKGLLKDKPVELISAVTDNLPQISGDRRRIRQILLNVVSNACKFTEKGRITIVARYENEEVHIFVSDTGPGIAPADQPLVFEEFRQVKNNLAETPGTGLGMPISKYFVEAHGGRIWFESQESVGTTFHIVLPIHSDAIKSAAAAKA